MGKFNLKEIKPNVVSKDLSGYLTYIYGEPGVGKTTLVTTVPKHLLLAFEPGYKAIPGAVAIDITSWAELKQVMRELKDADVKDMYDLIGIDTIDIAAQYCEKYVCAQNGVEKIGEIPYGGGWSMLKKEFESCFRTIAQLGYALFFISHDKEKTVKYQDGTEFQMNVPTLTNTYNQIVEGMVDFMAYAYESSPNPNVERAPKLILRSQDGSCRTKSRVKYVPYEIDLSYESFCKAIRDGIDQEAKEHGGKYVSETKTENMVAKIPFKALMDQITSTIQGLLDADQEINSAKITHVIEKHLGKGKKVMEATEDQYEMIELILDDLTHLG